MAGGPGGGGGGGAVSLGGVLAGVGAAAMAADAAVGVHDVLAAGEPGVRRGPAQDKRAAAVDVDVRVFVHPGADDGLDHLLRNVVPELLAADVGGGLGGGDAGRPAPWG